jgi:hypothetical protein
MNAKGKEEESKYPEHDKLQAVKVKSQACGEFIEWLQHKKKIELASRHSHTDSCEDAEGESRCGLEQDQLIEHYGRMEELLAEFFGIDRKKLELEKRAMLADLQRENRKNK